MKTPLSQDEIKGLEDAKQQIIGLAINKDSREFLAELVERIINKLEPNQEAYISDDVNTMFEEVSPYMGFEWWEDEEHYEYLIKATELQQIIYLVEQLIKKTSEIVEAYRNIVSQTMSLRTANSTDLHEAREDYEELLKEFEELKEQGKEFESEGLELAETIRETYVCLKQYEKADNIFSLFLDLQTA